VSAGGTTIVPGRVLEFLGFGPEGQPGAKILWLEERREVTVQKGTPQSSFRKTRLRSGGRAAVPRHIRGALGMRADKAESLVWVLKGGRAVVRRGPRRSGAAT